MLFYNRKHDLFFTKLYFNSNLPIKTVQLSLSKIYKNVILYQKCLYNIWLYSVWKATSGTVLYSPAQNYHSITLNTAQNVWLLCSNKTYLFKCESYLNIIDFLSDIWKSCLENSLVQYFFENCTKYLRISVLFRVRTEFEMKFLP